jgi:hypothetical protein
MILCSAGTLGNAGMHWRHLHVGVAAVKSGPVPKLAWKSFEVAKVASRGNSSPSLAPKLTTSPNCAATMPPFKDDQIVVRHLCFSHFS